MESLSALSVTELNSMIKDILEGSMMPVIVKGEISNYIDHSSGHIYFSIKDKDSQLRCTLWRFKRSALKFKPKNGDSVEITGNIQVYTKGGTFSLNVESIKPEGAGDLQKQFEELRNRLQKEGYFDEDIKKKLPYLPSKIGIVTAATGAAIKDIINIANRRMPSCKLIIRDTLVQGNNAKKDIADAINEFNKLENELKPDLLIIGRGGGSMEDLWAFNSEIVVKAIFDSSIPIISAVGHEIDFTLSDFASDLRAPTPSAAAELSLPQQDELILYIKSLEDRSILNLNKYIEFLKEKLKSLTSHYLFTNPIKIVNENKERINHLNSLLKLHFVESLNYHKHKLNNLKTALNLLNPNSTLKRGYSILRKDGCILNSSKDINIGDEIETILYDGKLVSEIKKITTED